MAKCFSFSSSDGLVQICVTLSWLFSHKTAPFYTEQCTSPLLFHNFEVSWGGSNWSLKNYGFIAIPFCSQLAASHLTDSVIRGGGSVDHKEVNMVVVDMLWSEFLLRKCVNPTSPMSPTAGDPHQHYWCVGWRISWLQQWAQQARLPVFIQPSVRVSQWRLYD